MSIGVFTPSYSLISSITLGVQTVVTFPDPHDFTVGEIISFRVSQQYGTVELNNRHELVQATDSLSILVDIDSRDFTPFIPNPAFPATFAMVVPSASGVVPGAIPAQTNLMDCFDHLPPR